MTRILAYVSLLVVLAWIPVFELVLSDPALENRLITMIVGVALLTGGIGPWFYALQKLHLLGQRRRLIICFLFWPLTPYFLFKLASEAEHDAAI